MAGPEPSFTFLDSPSLIPISVPGSPPTPSFRFHSSQIDGAQGQPDIVEKFLKAHVPGPPHSETRLNTGNTRWGCWSALKNPPKFRSGTLILDPNSETPHVVEHSGGDATRRSHHVPQAGVCDVRLRFVSFVPHFARTLTRHLYQSNNRGCCPQRQSASTYN